MINKNLYWLNYHIYNAEAATVYSVYAGINTKKAEGEHWSSAMSLTVNMKEKNYLVQINYANSIEDISYLRHVLGAEYLKLIRDYLTASDISINQKRDIVSLINAGIKGY